MDHLGTQPEPVNPDNWVSNYFNYYTEIEEHFQRVRGTALFLLSPLDWALVETWKNSGVPLGAVLRGIDAAFEKWRAKKSRTQLVNSLAFCAQAVLTEAQRSPDEPPRAGAAPAFPEDDLRRYLVQNAEAVRSAGYREIAETLDGLAAGDLTSLEALEQRLSALEQKLIALAQARATDEEGLDARRDLDAQIRPYRGKMTAEQISMLERQFMERHALDSARLPRLSLFYLR